MAEGQDYLSAGFREQQDEHRELLSLAKQVVAVFETFVSEDQWPYEVKEGCDAPKAERYSQSTNAMILFALVAAAGRIAPQCPLLPRVRNSENLQFDETTLGKYGHAWNRLTTESQNWFEHPNLSSLVPSQRHVSHSASFGWDDPFTLTWLVELDRANPFGQAAPREASTTIRERAMVRAEEGPAGLAAEGTAGRLLAWHPGSVQGNLSPADLETLKKGGYVRSQTVSLDHAFPALRYVHLQQALRLIDPTHSFTTSHIRRFMEDRLHNQLSRSSIRDGGFDPAELAFAMEGLLLLAPNMIGRSVLERVFSVLSENQDATPYWRPVKPFVTTPQGHVFLPLSVETANSLLRSCALIRAIHPDLDYFGESRRLFKRYADWLRARCRRGRSSSGHDFVGWHSEHVHFHEGIHLWETSQVLLFFLHYAALLEEHIARAALNTANVAKSWPRKRSRTPAVEYWRSDERTIGEPLAGLDEHSRLAAFSTVGERLVARRAESRVAGGYFSLLLYGPPGTSKTGMAEEISRALQWPLITVTPSDFIRGGESQVEERAKVIFDVLAAQSDAVILFDEIDRMILDRNSAKYGEQSDTFQFMTPSMLTKLRDLRAAERVVFVIATNYVERIDAAAKRKGRIDEILLLAPPDLAGRRAILQGLLKQYGKSPSLEKATLNEQALDDVARATPLWVYGELKRLFEDAWKSLHKANHMEADAIAKALKERLPPPAISLASYRTRFSEPQKPYQEFFVLLFLLLEAGRQPEGEDNNTVVSVFRQIAQLGDDEKLDPNQLQKNVEVSVREHVMDSSVADVILTKYDFNRADR